MPYDSDFTQGEGKISLCDQPDILSVTRFETVYCFLPFVILLSKQPKVGI